MAHFLDEYGAPLTSFTLFVRPTQVPTHTTTSTRPKTIVWYKDLSLELILNIYKFCDAATLFQLIRACPFGRDAARKLFWAHSDVWYSVSSRWLIHHAGFPGPVWHCAKFARYIQQLEVDFDREMGIQFKNWPRMDDEPRPQLPLVDNVKRFWNSLYSNFPAVRYVVLRTGEPYIPHENPAQVPNLHVFLLREKPVNVELILSFLQREPGTPKSIVGSQERVAVRYSGTGWQVRGPDPSQQRVLIPNKRFAGPVGEVQHYRMYSELAQLSWRAVRKLRFEAYDYYHFTKGASVCYRKCLKPDCQVTFTQPGEWGLHATRTSHDVSRLNEGEMLIWKKEFFPICCAVAGTDPALPERTVELERLKEISAERGQLLREKVYVQGIGIGDSDFVKAFIAQLEGDPSCMHQQPARQSPTFAYLRPLLRHQWYVKG